MPISMAIIGASGAVGSTLAAQVLRSQLLEPCDRLQLVGHGSAASEGKLLGTRIDLLDAFDDERVEIEVVPKIIDVDADIVVIAAGVGLSLKRTNRRDVAIANRSIFEKIADECASRVPDALFIVVSNPVELGVDIFASRLERRRVFGMGAQQDSLRFARAIAKDLGISRRQVRASVLGEHGQSMVPLWSAVEVLASSPDVHRALDQLKEECARTPLRERVAAIQPLIIELVRAGEVPEAYEIARHALPDARIFVEPFITARSMHSTPNATSNATLQCIVAALACDHRRVHGQVLLEGEVLDLHGTCGVPITLSRDGWHPEPLDWLEACEKEMLLNAAASIRDFTLDVLSQPQPPELELEEATI
ncbi:lactate dehydrogenase [Alloacidobacterium dinghuense]|uniref:Lactate dehydrogenase n=1 Tax=Alloacidobacterium dinghuense TaxID=2763107 RepID=A0A7G8BHK4_9BACT|nr:lactate dehydrogenase [Alloacidobacterium dinghuense]QNI32024.1 lactate dehydrogenase [Alloacidobacterium dinghuense]